MVSFKKGGGFIITKGCNPTLSYLNNLLYSIGFKSPKN